MAKPRLIHTAKCRALTAWFDAGDLAGRQLRWLCTGNGYCQDQPCRCLEKRALRKDAHAECEILHAKKVVEEARNYPGDAKSRAAGDG